MFRHLKAGFAAFDYARDKELEAERLKNRKNAEHSQAYQTSPERNRYSSGQVSRTSTMSRYWCGSAGQTSHNTYHHRGLGHTSLQS